MCTAGLRFRWSNHRELSLKRLYCQLKLYSPGAYSTGVLSWPQNVCSFQLSCKREPAVYPLLKGIMRLYSSELVQIHRWGGGGALALPQVRFCNLRCSSYSSPREASMFVTLATRWWLPVIHRAALRCIFSRASLSLFRFGSHMRNPSLWFAVVVSLAMWGDQDRSCEMSTPSNFLLSYFRGRCRIMCDTTLTTVFGHYVALGRVESIPHEPDQPSSFFRSLCRASWSSLELMGL